MKYRVKFDGTVVYAAPRRWKMLYTVSKGSLWEGDEVPGQRWHHNALWVKGQSGFVWRGDLDEVDDAERRTDTV